MQGMPQPKPATEPKPLRGAPAAKQRVWVGVRVSKTFHRRILTECARRDLSIQELLVAAMKWLFETPRKDWSHADLTFYYEDSGLTRKEAHELEAWSRLWEKYIQKVPREKIEVMEAAMQWDLRTLKSSRRKPAAWKPVAPKEKG
jgi:hypothetical protein